MDVREMLKTMLKIGGYDGLVNTDVPCGCLIGDLAPCDECLNLDECVAGYVHYCETCYKMADQESCDVDGMPQPDGWCVSLTKVFQPKKVEPESEEDPLFIRPEDTKVGDYITFRAFGNRCGSGRVTYASAVCGLDVTLQDGAIVACNWCDILSVQRPEWYSVRIHVDEQSDSLAAMDFAVIQRQVERGRKT